MANVADLAKELINNKLAFTSEKLKKLERVRSMPITIDEDCPEADDEIQVG